MIEKNSESNCLLLPEIPFLESMTMIFAKLTRSGQDATKYIFLNRVKLA